MGYRVAEFANLTGVTVRALQHYDRLGLLRPSRTESGHRVYVESDQARVRHILALRAVGMSLQQIRDALDAPASRLAELFQVQRARLERSRTGIEEALGVLQQVEAAFGNAGPGPLDRLASAVEMQDVLESMRTYFTDEAWTKGPSLFPRLAIGCVASSVPRHRSRARRGSSERTCAAAPGPIHSAVGLGHRIGHSAGTCGT